MTSPHADKLAEVLTQVVERLRRAGRQRTGPPPGGALRLSQSRRPLTGIDIHSATDQELRTYIGQLHRIAYFTGLGPVRYSYEQMSGFWKIVRNAAIIEIAKYLPYKGRLDKNVLYRLIGVFIGEDVTIAPRVQLDYLNPELITIGRGSLIGDSARIWTHNYDLSFAEIGSVVIGENVLIGSEAVIGPGTIIGNNVRIGYGAVLHQTSVGDNARVGFFAALHRQAVPEGATVPGRRPSRVMGSHRSP